MLSRMKKAKDGQDEALEMRLKQSPLEDAYSYEELFRFFSQGAEKLLIRLAAALAVVLVLVQLALLLPAVRNVLVPVERLEGVPFDAYPQAENP
jgi:hypothetical protein